MRQERQRDEATKRRRERTGRFPPSVAPSLRRSVASLGFTFTEVLFAVIILGLGFIMVAALFPVGIKQTMNNSEETYGSALGRQGVAVVQNRTANTPLTSTGGLVSPVPWSYINLDAIATADQRYAWTALYRREANSKLAAVYVFPLASRVNEVFGVADIQQTIVTTPAYTIAANLEPKKVRITLEYNAAGGTATIQAKASPQGVEADYWRAAVENAYIVVAGTGRVYRLGAADPATAGKFDLIPGSSMVSILENATAAEGFVIGRGYAEPANPAAGYAGTAMPVGVYVGVIAVD